MERLARGKIEGFRFRRMQYILDNWQEFEVWFSPSDPRASNLPAYLIQDVRDNVGYSQLTGRTGIANMLERDYRFLKDLEI